MKRVLHGSLASVLLIALLPRTAPSSSTSGHLAPIASMRYRRADHTATLLRTGQVLIAGGMVENGVFLSSAELYDPAKGAFLPTGSMRSRRVEHTATLLPNGTLLIAGGLGGRSGEDANAVTATTEIYDPTLGRFAPGPMMTARRTGHGALLLPDGRVLIVGGADNDGHGLKTAEIYDPATNRFAATSSMQAPRVARTTVLLKDGRVLVTGGDDAALTAEIYDPGAATWQMAGSMASRRAKHAATVLADGRVLITGGSPDRRWHPMRSAEIFDPRTNTFTALPDMELPRFKLSNATVAFGTGALIAGGAAEVEVYDNASGRFLPAGSVEQPHFFSTATLLNDGGVLICGGYGLPSGRPNGPISTERAWLYRP